MTTHPGGKLFKKTSVILLLSVVEGSTDRQTYITEQAVINKLYIRLSPYLSQNTRGFLQ